MLNLSLNSKKEKLITAFLISSLLVSFFMVSVRAPITNPSTYQIQRTCQPSRLDPARAYDTVSCELIQNVYQTLIFWNDTPPITFTPGVGYNLTTADYSDLDSYKPVLCTEVPTLGNGRLVINASGSYWRFTINTTAVFQPWAAANGSIIPSRNITAADVVYSFRREMVYDSPYGPSWMWFEPAFGIMGWSAEKVGGLYNCYTNGTFKHVADEAAAATMIQQWCFSVGNDVYFHFQQPRAESVLRQIFAQTWGSIVNPDWVKEMGGWDDLFTIGASDSNMMAGWTNNYHWKPTDTRSELDTYKDPAIYGAKGSKYTSYTKSMCGTGPYKFTSWDEYITRMWRVDQFAAYWRGWAGSHVNTVIWSAIGDWPTTKMEFLSGEFDEIDNCPPYYIQLNSSSSYYDPIPGIEFVYNISLLSNEAVFFTMNVSGASPYQSYVGYPTHRTNAEPLFFANEHMRKAFAWALNYSAYIATAYSGEAIQQASWWVDGIGPPAFKNTALTLRNLNYAEMQSELNAAVIDGFNVSIEGFDTSLVYCLGEDQRKIALDMIATAFKTLGSKYHCNVVGVDCPVFRDAKRNKYIPVYCSGWLADFVDPDDFARVYMYSVGNFPIRQGPLFPADQLIIDAEIDAAATQTNPTTRMGYYKDLQERYYNDCISIPLVQPVGRRWTRDWVGGWFYNALFRGDCFYDPIDKEQPPPQDVNIAALTIAPVTPQYPVVLLCPQSRYLIIGNGNSAPANQSYLINVQYYGGGAILVLHVVVGLKITGPDVGGIHMRRLYTDPQTLILVPSEGATVTLWWNGTDPGPIYGNSTGVPWNVSVEAQPINGNAQDTDLSDNVIADGTVVIKTLAGDITNNGLVDIYDAIKLANAFGTKSGARAPPGDKMWNPYADLNGDGQVDLFDAIILAGNFNKHVP